MGWPGTTLGGCIAPGALRGSENPLQSFPHYHLAFGYFNWSNNCADRNFYSGGFTERGRIQSEAIAGRIKPRQSRMGSGHCCELPQYRILTIIYTPSNHDETKSTGNSASGFKATAG